LDHPRLSHYNAANTNKRFHGPFLFLGGILQTAVSSVLKMRHTQGEHCMRSVVRILAAGLLLFALAANSSAQVSATIGGTVSDVSNALLPGVEVTATNVNTGINTTQITNEAGAYQIPSLQPGTYRLKAALPGFQTATRHCPAFRRRRARISN
jgi:hypothetical protein